MKKAQVGIVSMGYEGNTCNMHLNELAKIIKQGVWDNDLVLTPDYQILFERSDHYHQ